MSAEILAIVISAVGVVVTLGVSMFGGFAWILRRIDGLVDGLEEKLSTRIDALAGEVTGVKIAIARLEGPPRHLVTTTR